MELGLVSRSWLSPIDVLFSNYLSTHFRFADSIKRRSKSLLIAFLTGGTISGTVFVLTCEQTIPFSKALIYVSFIITGVSIVAIGPIFLELVVECTYPVPEELSTGFMMMLGNVLMLLCYFVFMLPNMDIRWINWSAVASIGIGVPILLLYRERFTRLDVEALSSLSKNENQ